MAGLSGADFGVHLVGGLVQVALEQEVVLEYGIWQDRIPRALFYIRNMQGGGSDFIAIIQIIQRIIFRRNRRSNIDLRQLFRP
jgi:hypothetical protein